MLEDIQAFRRKVSSAKSDCRISKRRWQRYSGHRNRQNHSPQEEFLRRWSLTTCGVLQPAPLRGWVVQSDLWDAKPKSVFTLLTYCDQEQASEHGIQRRRGRVGAYLANIGLPDSAVVMSRKPRRLT